MEKTDKIQILRQCPLFSALNPKELELVEQLAVLQTYDRQGIIFAQDAPCSGFYLLVDGLIKVYRISPDGKEQILFLVQPRNTFAEASLFLGGKYPANAEAIKKSNLLFFPKGPFIHMMKQDSDLSLKMMAGLSQWLHRLVTLVDNLTLKDAESRLASYLIDLVPHGESAKTVKVELPLAKNILAAQLGITSETLSRTLHKFQEQKWLLVDGKTVTLYNLPKLSELTQQE